MDSVPGMSHMPQVTYRLQSPPPPLNGYVHGATSDADIIFRTKRPFCVSTDESAISLTSNRMFDIHYQAKQFTEMITAAVHLKSIREKALESLELQNHPIALKLCWRVQFGFVAVYQSYESIFCAAIVKELRQCERVDVWLIL